MDLLIGDALMRWDIIKQQELDAALSLSTETALPLGKSLIALNMISATDLRISVQLQSMLRDEILSSGEAERIMHLCRVKKISLSQALIKTGLISVSGQRSRLGQLLVDFECLEERDLPRLLQITQTTGLPLGMVLVNCRAVNQTVLDTVIRIQKLRRSPSSAEEHKALKGEIDKVRGNCKSSTVIDTRLGSLLLNGEVISKAELRTALDISLVNQSFIGQLLVEFSWITAKTLEAALELQQALRQGLMDIESAAQILRSVHITQNNMQGVMKKRTPVYIRKMLFGKFLIISGFIDQHELETASHDFVTATVTFDAERAALIEKIKCEDPYVVKDLVCKAGLASPRTIDVGLKYWQLARDGFLPLVKAMVLFADHVLEGEELLRSQFVSAAPS